MHATSVKVGRRAWNVVLRKCFDFERVILSSLTFVSPDVEFHMFTDSKCVYDILATLVRTKEKRLMERFCVLSEAYERLESTKVTWISGARNVADCLTKRTYNRSVLKLMKKWGKNFFRRMSGLRYFSSTCA